MLNFNPWLVKLPEFYFSSTKGGPFAISGLTLFFKRRILMGTEYGG